MCTSKNFQTQRNPHGFIWSRVATSGKGCKLSKDTELNMNKTPNFISNCGNLILYSPPVNNRINRIICVFLLLVGVFICPNLPDYFTVHQL